MWASASEKPKSLGLNMGSVYLIYIEREREMASERARGRSVRVTIRVLGAWGFRGFRAWGIRFQTVVSETTTSVKGVRF